MNMEKGDPGHTDQGSLIEGKPRGAPSSYKPAPNFPSDAKDAADLIMACQLPR